MKHHRISFVGAPGTGKSTLAQALAVRLKLAGYDAEYCGEYARSYLRRSGPVATPFENFVTLAGNSAREDELQVHHLAICDSAAFIAEVYYRHDWSTGDNDSISTIKLENGLDEIRRLCIRRLRSTSQIFYVPLFSFESHPDPTRRYNDDRERLDLMIKSFLDNNDANYYTITSGDLEDRVDETFNHLSPLINP
jgi:nicotinamide riboside kinase